jgi:kinesin family protein 18/19
MLGTESRPGIMALTLADLFNKIEKGGIAHPDETCDVSLTYLEIYNENIRDLLSGKPDLLDLRDDGSRGTVVAGITTVTASSAEEVSLILQNRSHYHLTHAGYDVPQERQP